MICVRCGHCCYSMSVVIRDDRTDTLRMKPGGILCPYLLFNGAEAYCAVHDKPWYCQTPCHFWNQPYHNPDQPCIIGRSIMEDGGFEKVIENYKTAELDNLEDIGRGEGVDPLMVKGILIDIESPLGDHDKETAEGGDGDAGVHVQVP